MPGIIGVALRFERTGDFLGDAHAQLLLYDPGSGQLEIQRRVKWLIFAAIAELV